jgi:hypothetical protein
VGLIEFPKLAIAFKGPQITGRIVPRLFLNFVKSILKAGMAESLVNPAK